MGIVLSKQKLWLPTEQHRPVRR